MSYLSTHLSTFASRAGVDLPEDTFGARLAHLSGLMEDCRQGDSSGLLGSVVSYREKLNRRVRKGVSKVGDSLAGDFYELVSARMMSSLLLGMKTSHQSNSRSKRHHWVPNIYLRGFDQRPDAYTKKTPNIPVLRYDGQGHTKPNLMSNGKELCHNSDGDIGFYPDAMEHMFSTVEGYYAQVKHIAKASANAPATVSNRDMIALVCLLLIQAVRLPECGTKREFVQHDFAALADALDEKLIALSRLSPCVAFVDTSTKLGFTLKAPVLNANTAEDMVSTVYFPLGPHAALILSSKPIDEAKRIEVATQFHWRMVSETRKNAGQIYGVEMKHTKENRRLVSIDLMNAYLSASDTSVRREGRFTMNGANEERAAVMKEDRDLLHSKAASARKASTDEATRKRMKAERALIAARRAEVARNLDRAGHQALAVSAMMRSVASSGSISQQQEQTHQLCSVR